MQYSGFLIRKKRLEKSWSQEGLCKGICAVSYLSKIEQGKAEAFDDILFSLFERLGINWICDDETIRKGKSFIEEWYDSAFSADFEKLEVLLNKYKNELSFLENSIFAIDIMLLKNFSEDTVLPVDEKLEVCMDSRQLALQRILCGNFQEAEKLFPCAFMSYRKGVDAYEKGRNSDASRTVSAVDSGFFQ